MEPECAAFILIINILFLNFNFSLSLYGKHCCRKAPKALSELHHRKRRTAISRANYSNKKSRMNCHKRSYTIA